jgi:hypothetical protein
MKKMFSFCLFAIVLMAGAAFASVTPQGNANVVGTWDITIESPQGTRTSMLVIKQEGDKLTAAMKSDRGERPLKSINVTGNDITMVMTIQFQGDEMTITYKGKVESDSMKGDADFGGLASGTWSAVPHKEATAPQTVVSSTPGAGDISGAWNFAVELDEGGTGNPTFTFKQEGEKLTGTYKGPLGEAPVTGMIKGMDVKFSYKVKYEGADLEGTYTGKLTGKDAMTGTVSFSGTSLSGSGKWTAKKQ